MANSAHFDLKVPIPQRRLEGGEIDGDSCVHFPTDMLAWKKALQEHLEGNEEMFLTITDGYGSDFALILSALPDENLVNGLEKGKLFGFTMNRETLETLGRAIQFALQENSISNKSE
ncbi:MAG: hypothetical protein KAR42_03045 [candidate division Zixibacteria bacterium]|nr:hypothetical protein [candidate division Zixibacteria bacterium]